MNLKPQFYDRVQPLFTELIANSYALLALLDGINPGWIIVDNANNPQCAFAYSVEGCFLAGNPDNIDFLDKLNAYLNNHLLEDNNELDTGGIYMQIHPDTWDVGSVFYPREPMTFVVRNYDCVELKYREWRDDLPDGFTVHQVDSTLLNNPDLTIPKHLSEWIENNWGNREHYLKHGFGFCVIHEDAITHWSIADCATKDGRCDIGICSIEEHRRKGLAAITAAASVEYALNHGFNTVGWRCVDNNIGSYKTAEKVGFQLKGKSTVYYCMLTTANQLREYGWYHFLREEYQKTVISYDQLAARMKLPNYIYHTAALANAAENNIEAAFKYLYMAIDAGWDNLEHTKNHELLKPLHEREAAWNFMLSQLGDFKDKLPEEIVHEPTVNLIMCAYPHGIPNIHYRTLLAILAEDASIRVLASAIAHIRNGHYATYYNDVIEAKNFTPDEAILENVKRKLMACGYEEWRRQ